MKDVINRSDLSRLAKMLLVLNAESNGPIATSEIKKRAIEAGLRSCRNWNIASILGQKPEMAVRLPHGWEITEAGRSYLVELGLADVSPQKVNLAADLRAHIATLTDPATREFLNEALTCYEVGSLRASVVFSWVGAVWILQSHVFNNHLAAFNGEAIKRDAKFRPVKAMDDFGRMQEFDFLQIIVAISIIGKNVKQQLEQRLTLRNAAGHPNSLVIGPQAVAAHIETLLDNVYRRF